MVADIALARAGALSVSELIAVGVPSILVPYPWSADDHQIHNAAAVVDKGGAVMIADSELDGKSLASAIKDIIQTEGKIESMRESLAKEGIRNSADIIADDITRLIETGIASEIDQRSGNDPAGRG